MAGLTGAQAAAAIVGEGSVGAQIEAALRGTPPKAEAGKLRLLAATDGSGCPVVAVADGRVTPPVWSAITVLDDSDAAVAEDERHKRRWRAWLYWSNLLQFLERGGGDSAQLTTSLLDGFSAQEFSVAGGAGWLESTRTTLVEDAAPAQPPAATEPPLVAAPVEPVMAGVPAGARDGGWGSVLELLDPDEPGLELLAVALASFGAPAPRDGYELDDRGWMAELAWPDAKVGVVLAPKPVNGEPDAEAEDRDRAFAAAGWEVRPAGAWSAKELADQLGVRGGGAAGHRDQRNDGTTQGRSHR